MKFVAVLAFVVVTALGVEGYECGFSTCSAGEYCCTPTLAGVKYCSSFQLPSSFYSCDYVSGISVLSDDVYNLSTGAIIGISIGGVVFIGLCIAACVSCFCSGNTGAVVGPATTTTYVTQQPTYPNTIGQQYGYQNNMAQQTTVVNNMAQQQTNPNNMNKQPTTADNTDQYPDKPEQSKYPLPESYTK